MLCVFQVNNGEFLTISDEIQPTSRVYELTVALSRQQRIPEDKQVLLTHDGRLLEHQEMIGAYGVGTETMPILLYDMSLIKGETHRQPLVVAELGENYSRALEVMRQSNNDMKQQITLAKKLATSCDVLSEKCVKVVKEQQLQLQGWNAAVANSNTVLKSFIQQVNMLKEGAGSFTKSKAVYQRLIENFPLVLDQLKQMIIPSQLLGEHENSHCVTLLDWIGTHDQSSTLSELAKECKSALESQGEERIQRVISDAESAIESIPDQGKALEEWKSKMASDDHNACVKRVCTLAEEVKDFVKKLVATSERALNSGDKLVVKELTMSNWKTLSMMSTQHSEIQSLVNDCISYKEQLTSELNQQLRLVSEVQTKVSDSECHIPLLKERIRRITHRFTILSQISEAPKILASAIAEIIRRKRFHEQFVKLTEETCEHLGKIRSTEIQAREKFINENSKHFLAQLFHQALNDRPPNVNSPLRRPFDQQLLDISKEEVYQVLAVVSVELQQQLKNAMSFSVEQSTNTQVEIDSSMYTSASDNDHLVKEISKLESEKRQHEQEVEQLKVHNKKLIDSHEALEKKLDNLEEEKMAEVRKLEKQVEYLADQQSRIEKSAMEEKLNISNKLEEKNEETSTLQTVLDGVRKQLEYYKLLIKEKVEEKREETSTLQATLDDARKELEYYKLLVKEKVEEKSEETLRLQATLDDAHKELEYYKLLIKEKVEEKSEETLTLQATLDDARKELEYYKLLVKEKMEEKSEETLRLQATLDDAHKELEYYKLLVKEKEQLLEEQMIKFEKQEFRNTELMGMQEAIVKEKDALLDSQAKSMAELTNKLKMSTESVENEKIQKSMVETNKQILEENLKELKAELYQTKAMCDHLKLNLEKLKKDQLDHLQSVNEEKDLELSRVENKMHPELDELQSVISNLRHEKIQLTTENSLLSETIDKLRIEIDEKTAQISNLELPMTELNNKLHDIKEQHCAMEKSFKNQLAEKEQEIVESKRLQEILNEKLEAETNKVRKSEQKIDKLIAVLEEHKKIEVQLKEKITGLETDIEDRNKKLESITLQLKDAKETASLHDKTQTKIAQYESDISLTKETKNKEIESLSLQLKEYVEKFEVQAKKIMQYKNEILLMKENNNKEFREREIVIAEKQNMIEKLSEQNSALENDVDKWQKKYMEAERDLKEHERMLEKNSFGKSMWSSTSSKDMIDSTSAIVPTPVKSEASSASVLDLLSVKLTNLQVDDYAIFMPDKYHNYLAVTVDGKVYYLDKKSSCTFTTFHELPCKLKMLVGKISGRVHCEVKKDNNRLRVPLGSKVYRLTADEWKPPS